MAIYTETLAAHCRCIEEILPEYLPQNGLLQDTVVQAMHYACSAGGKRIRPVLLMEFSRLTCGDATRAIPFAAAIEMLHTYSLVHDDLPCMDDSSLRRGKPTVHTIYGDAMALLTGDALLNRAFEVMLAADTVRPAVQLVAARTLADAAGILGMVGGQVIDLESEGVTIDRARLEALQDGKTAALLRAACRIGALLGDADAEQLAAAECFGENLGLCFQIVDDILDVTATAAVLGKPVGNDAAHEKATYVSLLGLSAARELAMEKTAAALEALSAFSGDTTHLSHLAEALLHREQ